MFHFVQYFLLHAFCYMYKFSLTHTHTHMYMCKAYIKLVIFYNKFVNTIVDINNEEN